MRSSILASIAALGLLAGPAGHASRSIPTTSITQLPYPAEVSLLQRPMGWTFESSANLPLYLYEPPASGAPACDRSCERQWLPLLASAGEKPLGDWTILVRRDGRRQWAFERHPVYTHAHDRPEMPIAARRRGVWHLMPYFPS
ncbi:MAG TPA: hypothetical protein VMD56_06295 [Steroidobacteraceae bacterium]|nr:hypothetical protein [Steroidobacteraceae bacterium]